MMTTWDLGDWILVAFLLLCVLTGPVAIFVYMFIGEYAGGEWWTEKKQKWHACKGFNQKVMYFLAFNLSIVWMICLLLFTFFFGSSYPSRDNRQLRYRRRR